jgi:FkbM family methyltransferase
MHLIKKIEKGLFFLQNPMLNQWRKYGFDYDQYQKLSNIWLKEENFETILDIGANIGQSAIALSLAFPEAIVHSFEPLPDCFVQLSNLSHLRPNIKAHNYALGSETGKISFEQNEYSASSSILKMADNHVKHFPSTKLTTTTSVPVIRLDDYANSLNIKSNLLIKLDVQGYEDKVIKGGLAVIGKAKVLIIETSFEELYNKQPLFKDLQEILFEVGLVYCGAFEQLISPIDGRILQQDAVFINKSL